ncbi:MAG: DUF4153 domain-containing protein [Bacillota bacterium]|nr:DUF4153 domain-containing protein [Bacillota bacterium]
MFKKLIKQIFNLIESLKKSSRRFPETILVAFGVVIVGIILNHTDYNQTETLETFRKMLLALILGIPIYSAGKLVVEKFNLTVLYRVIMDVGFAIFLVIYYYVMPEDINGEFMIKFMLLNISFYLLFSLIPYMFKRENYSRYILNIITNLFITLLFSLVLYLGINAIVFTVEELFELNFDNDIYFDLFIVIAGLFSVTHFLGSVLPIEKDIDNEYYPPVWRILFVYIVLPLLSVYTAILYAYFVRLLIIKEFPINILGHLVVWYGLISVIILFFINRIKSNNAYTQLFYKYFPVAIMLPLAMLFVAIGSRIAEFGLTPPRYFVVISGLWIFGSMIYIFFSKSFKSTILVMSAIVVLLISAYGPQSAFSLSINNQNNRFEVLLMELNMLKNDNIVPRSDLSEEEKKDINEFIRYFDRNHSFDGVRVLPEDFEYKNMQETFGFEYSYYYPKSRTDINYFYDKEVLIVDIKSFDYLADIFLDFRNDFILETEGISVEFDKNDKLIRIFIEEEVVAKIDLIQFIEDFDSRQNGQQPQTIDDVTVKMEFEKIQVEFIVLNLFYEPKEKNVDIDYGSMQFRMFIRIK